MNVSSEYNEEPVLFCKHCLSLKVQDIMGVQSLENMELYGSEFCGNCSSTSIGITTIEHWKELYKEKYHKNLISNGRK